MMSNPENLRLRELWPGDFLKRNSVCFYVLDYLRHDDPDNPQFILDLKNTFDNESIQTLKAAKETAKDIIVRWAPEVMRRMNLRTCTMVCIPRAKAFDSYTDTQMYLLKAVSEAAQALSDRGVTDGTGAIRRVVSTKTTHLPDRTERVTAGGGREANTGDKPYPGITKRTCQIDAAQIRGREILLVDDIYTGGVYIDEDCIQALYDAGAARVVLFTLSRTTPRKETA